MESLNDDKAYDGSDAPPTRELTARERDILCRGLESVLFSFTHGGTDFDKECRDAIMKYTRFIRDPDDLRILYNIVNVINPREYDRNPEIP